MVVNYHDSIVVGAACGIVSTAIPDEIATMAGKIVLAVFVSLLAGLAHSAAKALGKKLFHKHKDKDKEK